MTFGMAAQLYRSAGKSQTFLSPVDDYLSKYLLKDVTPGVIREMAIKLYGHCSGASKNRMAIIPARAVINFAAECSKCSPIRVKHFKEEKKEKHPADFVWIKEFGIEAHDHLEAYSLFMFLTGARPSEALAVQEKDLDLKKAEAIIRETKVSKERRVHLPPLLVAKLAGLERIKDRPIFGYEKYDAMLWSWTQTNKRADIKRLTPHCCRHGFATELLRRGVDVVTVAWLGGWANARQVLDTYAHAIRDRTLTGRLVDADLTRAIDDVEASARKIIVI